MCHPFDSHAAWIGLSAEVPDTGEHRQLPARYLRREFSVGADVLSARARICGLGVYDFRLNGQRVDDRLFAPGFTYFSRRALYVEHDILTQLRTGDNAIGVILGNGRFFAPRINSPTAFTDFGLPCLRFQLELTYRDGRRETLLSSTDWKATDQGPIRLNNEYDGELYDARMEMPGWDRFGFDDSAWQQSCQMETPTERLDRHDYPPDRVTMRLSPTSINDLGDGRFMVDFGQNFYGNIECRVSGPRGHEVRWTAAYSLHADGSLRTEDNRDALSCDRYILKGEGVEVWHPRFRGQGMRRLLVENWPGALCPTDLTGQVIHADMARSGDFECDNPLFNRLYQNYVWGLRMFRRHGAPLDPDRNERQGWLGEGRNVLSDFHVWNARDFYRKWLVDIQLDQRDDGHLPETSPNTWHFYGDLTVWPSAYLITIAELLRHYGDVEPAAAHYQNVVRWLLYIRKTGVQPDGTIEFNQHTDWCDASTIGKTSHHSAITSGSFISSAYWCYCLRETAFLAEQLGYSTEVSRLRDEYSVAHGAFLQRFVERDNHHISPSNTQCELAMLLGMELVEGPFVEKTAAALVQAIREYGNRPSVGLIGMQWLMRALEHPLCEAAGFDLVANEERPGWGYMVRNGATTFWENWDTNTREPGMNSEALLILAGSLGLWFFRVPGGIRQASDSIAFSKILLQPVIGNLHYARAEHNSPRGLISSEWELTGNKFQWKVEIPPGEKAEIHFPQTTIPPYSINAEPVEANCFYLESGSYSLSACLPECRR
ncbi:MAG: family 78 glycoside hydrolase catalytic domain [Terrimicrobiaceae bacterium]